MKPGWLETLRHFPPDYQTRRLQALYRRLTPSQQHLAETGLAGVVRQIPGSLTPAEKATILYRALAEYLRYDHAACGPARDPTQEQSYTYLGAIFNGTAVCSGIAQLYAILCHACDIPCRVVEGYAGSSGREGLHSWVQILLPDRHGIPVSYHCDPTWDLLEGKPYRCFQYFLKSDLYFETHYHQWYREIGADFGWVKFYYPCPADAPTPVISPEILRKVVEQLQAIRLEQPYILKKHD